MHTKIQARQVGSQFHKHREPVNFLVAVIAWITEFHLERALPERVVDFHNAVRISPDDLRNVFDRTHRQVGEIRSACRTILMNRRTAGIVAGIESGLLDGRVVEDQRLPAAELDGVAS